MQLYAKLHVLAGEIDKAAEYQAESQFLPGRSKLADKAARQSGVAVQPASDGSAPKDSPTAFENRTAVLGYAVGYGWEQMRVLFAVSLRRTGYPGDIVLFVESADIETRGNSLKLGVKLVKSSSRLLMRCHLCVSR